MATEADEENTVSDTAEAETVTAVPSAENAGMPSIAMTPLDLYTTGTEGDGDASDEN